MNATLQCLSNTELFAEYLGLGQYRAGRPEPSPEPEQPAGHEGEVTEQLAHLVRALWTLEYTPQHSRDFKWSSSDGSKQCVYKQTWLAWKNWISTCRRMKSFIFHLAQKSTPN